MTKDEMIVWHHQFSGHEFEQTPRDSGQRRLACCSPWSFKGLDMTQQLNNKNKNDFVLILCPVLWKILWVNKICMLSGNIFNKGHI